MLSKLLKYSWLPFIVYCIIFYLSCLINPDEVPEIEIDIPYFDKVVHFFMYFGLTAVSAIYYIHDKKGLVDRTKLILGALLLPILYGGLIEIVQENIIAGRAGDWIDFLADILGSIAGLLVALRYRDTLLLKKSLNEKNILVSTTNSRN